MESRARADEPVERSIDENTDQILKHIELCGALRPDVRAAEAAFVVLCALLRRLSGGEARDLVAALPPTLREILRPCALRRLERAQTFGRKEFLERVARDLRVTKEMAEGLSRAVFSAVQRHLPFDEVTDIESQLPMDLKNLWGRHRAT